MSFCRVISAQSWLATTHLYGTIRIQPFSRRLVVWFFWKWLHGTFFSLECSKDMNTLIIVINYNVVNFVGCVKTGSSLQSGLYSTCCRTSVLKWIGSWREGIIWFVNFLIMLLMIYPCKNRCFIALSKFIRDSLGTKNPRTVLKHYLVSS